MNERYELFRVITDYQALVEGFADRIEDLDTTYEQIDMAAGFCRNRTQKILNRKASTQAWAASGRDKRMLGWESLGRMLKGTGLALVLVVDDVRFAGQKALLLRRKIKRQQAIVGSIAPQWFITRENASEMGKRRMLGMSDAQRKRLARKAGKASGKARRMKRRAQLEQPVDPDMQQRQ